MISAININPRLGAAPNPQDSPQTKSTVSGSSSFSINSKGHSNCTSAFTCEVLLEDNWEQVEKNQLKEIANRNTQIQNAKNQLSKIRQKLEAKRVKWKHECSLKRQELNKLSREIRIINIHKRKASKQSL